MTLAPAGLVAKMLLWQHRWLIRRKYGIAFIDANWLRLQITVDYQCLPDLSRHVSSDEVATIPVPVSLLAKSPGQTCSYDLKDETGVSIALSTLDERLAFGRDVLTEMAALTAHESSQPLLAAISGADYRRCTPLSWRARAGRSN